ncbi:MAG: alpha/beta hydrolase [Stutzerimonas stutzeri]|nr:MAG: alpha/beta hydrolase [Stutzerimonas stutzeri]
MPLSRRSVLAAAAVLPVVPAASAPGMSQSEKQSFSVRSADGTELFGEAHGDAQAPEILFIHGLRQSRLSWDKQFDAAALRGFRLVRFDLRGHGDSDKPASLDAYSNTDRWAEDVAAIISAAKLRRPVLVGWSLGGYVAGAYLRKFGGASVAGVNFVDAVTKLSPDLLTPLAGTFTRTTTSHDLAERTGATADFLDACFHQPPTRKERERMLVVNGMTARAVNEGFVRTETTDLEPVIKEFAGPILLTHGAQDRLVRVAMSERIRALQPKARLSLYQDSGHSPFFEEPARYNRELAAFVRSTAQG